MNDDLQRKRKEIKKQLGEFSRSKKARLFFAATLLPFGAAGVYTFFLGDEHRLLHLAIVFPVSWLATVRLFLYTMELPDVRSLRWAFRIMVLASIINSLTLIDHLMNGGNP